MTTKLKVVNKIVDILPTDDTTTYPRLDFNLQNNTYSVPISTENPNDGSIAFSYKIGNIIYYIPNTISPEPLVLTNSKYKMREIYPDTYSSITTVPDLLNTSSLTNMGGMFGGCESITTIPQLDSSNATNMDYMFSYCPYITTIPELDTSKVTDMSYMFYQCHRLTTIPLLDTSNVTATYSMFSACASLTTVPQMDTSKVTNMCDMFSECSSLPSTFPWAIDCSSIDDASNMSYMFYDSSVTNVTLVNVSDSIKPYVTSQLLKGNNTLTINFVEKKVLTDSTYMMMDVYPDTCYSMRTISDLLDTSNLTTMAGMFSQCGNLTSIPQLDTSNITNMEMMFYDCTSLTSVPQLDTSNVTDMSGMFDGCSDLTAIPQLNTSKVTDMSHMFNYCQALTTIPQMDTSQVTNMQMMFYNCGNLPSTFPWPIDCSSISDINNIWTIFNGSSVTEVTLANVDSSIRPQITSDLLKEGDTTMTIHFI